MSSHLADPSLLGEPEETVEAVPDRQLLRDLLITFERRLIETALVAAGGNQRRAAKALGVLPTTFQEKLKRFGLIHPRSSEGRRSGERRALKSDAILEAHLTPQEKTKT
jgi:DNA-binding NtrC family response regulator